MDETGFQTDPIHPLHVSVSPPEMKAKPNNDRQRGFKQLFWQHRMWLATCYRLGPTLCSTRGRE